MTEELIGKTLGNYEIKRLIGQGGMAGVYEATQASVGRSVAVKVMDDRFSKDKVFVSRFKNEAQIIARLEHAHILPVFDFGDQQGTLYIVMRYLPTGTLEERIGDNGIPLQTVVKYTKQIAAALDYAHSRGIVHRDLKPGNVMLDNQENTFLTDFGIAKALDSDVSLTKTDNVVGTPLYMSPEQSMGQDIDGRSDVYALGVMVYEMLAGKLPYVGDTPMAVLLKHINDPIPSILGAKRSLPEELDLVIGKAMAKERSERFQTARELSEALEDAYSISIGEKPRHGHLRAMRQRQAPPETVPDINTPNPADDGLAAIKRTPVNPTKPSPFAGDAAAPTIERTPSIETAPAPLIPDVEIELNSLSQWLKTNAETIALWSQATLLSLATFIALLQLTSGGIGQIALLSVVPGLVIYGLLHVPTLGGITAMGLILVPLIAHSPGLGLLWALLIVFAGARLTSREIMLIVVAMILAGTPIGWIIPLAFPWWLKSRRVMLPAAAGMLFATIFAITLGWADGNGLLPVPVDVSVLAPEGAEVIDGDVVPGIALTSFDSTYLELFTDPAIFAAYAETGEVTRSITTTFTVLSNLLIETNGLPLVMAAAWALASVLTISNRRVQSPTLRATGLLLATGLLSLVTFFNFGVALKQPTTSTVIIALLTALVAFLLTQWPVQVDPNDGNQVGTMLQLMKRSLGALYMALGIVFALSFLGDIPPLMFALMWLLGTLGMLITLTDPLIGPPMVFVALVIGLSQVDVTLTVVMSILLVVYLIVTFLFDRSRPRRWNPLAAGLIIGAPGIAGAGLLPLAVLSVGALEAQVPAAILAVTSHIWLITATSDGSVNAVFVIVQVIVTLGGVLIIERLMAIGFLNSLFEQMGIEEIGARHKIRRLVFTAILAPIMALGYYVISSISLRITLPVTLILSVITAVLLVIGMGERARFWRRFFEREDEEESMLQDQEITGVF